MTSPTITTSISPPPPDLPLRALGGTVKGNSMATTSTTLLGPSSFPSPSPSLSSPQTFLSGGTSPSVIIGFISVGAFLLAVASFCAWRRLLGHRDVLPLPAFLARYRRRSWQNRGGYQRQEPGQDREGGHVDPSRKPEVFNAWIQRRTKDVSKWEELLVSLFIHTHVDRCLPHPPSTTAFVSP